MHVDVSDVSRILQLSTYSRPPPQTYVAPIGMSCAAHQAAAKKIISPTTMVFERKEILSPWKFKQEGPTTNPLKFEMQPAARPLGCHTGLTSKCCFGRTTRYLFRRE